MKFLLLALTVASVALFTTPADAHVVQATTSLSLTEIRFPRAAEKTNLTSSEIVCRPGTVMTGASLTGLTVMSTTSVSD